MAYNYGSRKLAANASWRSKGEHMVAGENYLRDLIIHIKSSLGFRVVMSASRALVRLFYNGRDEEISKLEMEGFARHVQADKLRQLGGLYSLAKQLNVDLRSGVEDDAEDLARRRFAFGENIYPGNASKAFWRFMCDASSDPALVILMLCALLSLILGIRSEGLQEGWYYGVSLAIAVVLVVLVTSLSDFWQSALFTNFERESENIEVKVLRGGRRMLVSIFDIVVGDIVELRIGDRVPADGVFITGQSLAIDEFRVTGEKELFIPNEEQPSLLSGSIVVNGWCSMLVTAVGVNKWDQAMATISDEILEGTPLQVRLMEVAIAIGKVGLSVAILVLVVLLVGYFTGYSSDNSGKFQSGVTSASEVANHIVSCLSVVVSMVVVAVPEGLPLALTFNLANSVSKMKVNKALARRLSACETMGCVTTVCIDQTGTLTTNQMSVVTAWIAGSITQSSQTPSLPKVSARIRSLLCQGLAYNSTGSIFVPLGGGMDQVELSGSPSEKALVLWGLTLGLDVRDVRSEIAVSRMETFNSPKQCAGAAVTGEDGKVLVHWKGGAEIMLSACDKWVNADGEVWSLSEDKRAELERVTLGMAESSLRCMAFAYCELESVPDGALEWKLPEKLTMLAIVGITDVRRGGAMTAVEEMQRAGVRVVMMTGDTLATAKAIAKDCAILRDGDMAVEGDVFRHWSEVETRAKLRFLSVVGGAVPSDRLLLVRKLQAMGEVVAATGSGSDDALVLQQADVGLHLGFQGTEVTKGSSDIAISDGDISSVVELVRWGRSIFSNMRKLLQFQLTVNMVALSVNLVGAITSGSVPLTPVQLLWVNLIMDTLAARALASEPPSKVLMHQSPIRSKEPLITNAMWLNIIGQVTYQVTVLLTLQFYGEPLLNLSSSTNSAVINRTVIFNTFVLCQIFNEVNVREPLQFNIFHGLLNNLTFIGVVVMTVVLQVLMVEVLGKFASTAPLNWEQWLVCIVLAALSWPICIFLKLIRVLCT